MEQCETCMMSDVVWYKNNPSESEITHETACLAWLFMIKGEAFMLRLLSRFEHIIMLLLVVCIKQKSCVLCKGGKTKCVKIGNGGNGVNGCVIEG